MWYLIFALLLGQTDVEQTMDSDQTTEIGHPINGGDLSTPRPPRPPMK